MKIIRLGPAGKNILIGEDSKTAAWFTIADNVKPFIKKYNVGDEVKIRSEKKGGANLLVFIERGNGSVSTKVNEGSSDMAAPAIREQSNKVPVVDKKAETPMTDKDAFYRVKQLENQLRYLQEKEHASIKAQAIGHMASRALISMQGTVSEENVFEISERLYKHFSELVNGVESKDETK